MVAEPGGQSVRISFQEQLGDAYWSGWVGDGRGARQPDARCPLEKEGQRGLGGGLVDPGASPAQEFTGGSHSFAAAHRQVEPVSKLVELVGPHRPAKRSAQGGCAPGDPSSEAAAGRCCRVDDGDQLQVAGSQRHDPIGGAPVGMSAAFDGGQAAARLELPCRGRKVGHGDQHMVKLHAVERTALREAARTARRRPTGRRFACGPQPPSATAQPALAWRSAAAQTCLVSGPKLLWGPSCPIRTFNRQTCSRSSLRASTAAPAWVRASWSSPRFWPVSAGATTPPAPTLCWPRWPATSTTTPLMPAANDWPT